MPILVHREGKEFGPYEEEDIRSFLSTGRFTPADLAWREGLADWQALGSFPEFAIQSVPARMAMMAPSLPSLPLNALGSYARATLQPNETPVFLTRVHPLLFVPSVVLGMVIGGFAYAAARTLLTADEPYGAASPVALPLLAAVVSFALCLVPALVTFYTSELVITDRRVLVKLGFLRRRTLEMFISKIESVSVSQGVLGRLVQAGTVTLRGTGGSAEPFPTIARPIEFRNCVQRIQSQNEAQR